MKPQIAIPLGVAGILSGIGTAIANTNGLFAGHPHLAYWFYAASCVMLAVAVIGWIAGSRPDKSAAMRMKVLKFMMNRNTCKMEDVIAGTGATSDVLIQMDAAGDLHLDNGWCSRPLPRERGHSRR